MYADAIDNLQKLNPDKKAALGPYLDQLRLSWAEVEAYKVKDQAKVVELMEDYLKHNTATMLPWMNYIKLIRTFPDHEKPLRSLFKRALNLLKEGKSQLA